MVARVMPDGYAHGVQGYVYYGCRCPVCTQSNTDRARASRADRAVRVAAGDPEVPHGEGGYRNWCCHCPVCTKANRDKCRAYRQARREKRKGTVT